MAINKNPFQITTTGEGLMALGKIRRSPEWGAILALQASFLEKYKGDCFRLNPSDIDLGTQHANIAGKALGIVEFIEYIEKAEKKVEDRFIEMVREDQIKNIARS